jgi:hypothetical protein
MVSSQQRSTAGNTQLIVNVTNSRIYNSPTWKKHMMTITYWKSLTGHHCFASANPPDDDIQVNFQAIQELAIIATRVYA